MAPGRFSTRLDLPMSRTPSFLCRWESQPALRFSEPCQPWPQRSRYLSRCEWRSTWGGHGSCRHLQCTFQRRPQLSAVHCRSQAAVSRRWLCISLPIVFGHSKPLSLESLSFLPFYSSESAAGCCVTGSTRAAPTTKSGCVRAPGGSEVWVGRSFRNANQPVIVGDPTRLGI